MNVERGLSHLRVGKIMKKKVQNKFETASAQYLFLCFVFYPILSYHIMSNPAKSLGMGQTPLPPLAMPRFRKC